MADLDRQATIRHKLYRDKTNFHGGKLLKDLRRLDRDLKRVIVLDHQMSESVLQAENCFKLSQFKDDINDKELLNLADMLEKIQKYNV